MNSEHAVNARLIGSGVLGTRDIPHFSDLLVGNIACSSKCKNISVHIITVLIKFPYGVFIAESPACKATAKTESGAN